MPIGVAQQGVMIPQAQRGADVDGPPMTVLVVGPMTMQQVRWFDEVGRGHDEVWFIGPGNVVYQPPNSETWASELKPVKEELVLQVLSKLGAIDDRRVKGALPADSVDVLEEKSVDTSAT